MYVCLQAGYRAAAPPLIQHRAGVAWKDPGFDDAGWPSVDVPHDFILPGNGEGTCAVCTLHSARGLGWRAPPSSAPRLRPLPGVLFHQF